MWIYNRWGELVYYTYDYDAEWNGTNSNGVLVPDGLYIWKIKYTDYKTDLPVDIQGHVIVLK